MLMWSRLRLCRGLHFLVIQADEDAEESAGIWLLQDQVVPIF